MVEPRDPNQRTNSSGLVQASQTSRRGALKTRAITISRSPRPVTLRRSRSSVAMLSPVRRLLEAGDVDLPHPEHGLHGSAGPLRILVAEQLAQPVRDDLPREAVLVLQPAAHALLATIRRELRPQSVDLLLRLA